MPDPDTASIMLAGDVMTGRRLNDYLLTLADPAAIWGEALAVWQDHLNYRRVVNLETAITTEAEAFPHKRFHFRMHPDNLHTLVSAGIDVCTVANNHIMDAGARGLTDTLEQIQQAGIATSGAGADASLAAAPTATRLADGRRLLVFAWAHPSSFTPRGWAAGAATPGVNLLPDYSIRTLAKVARHIRREKGPDDIVLAAIHWGPNWGYRVNVKQRWFARRLVDMAGVDLIQGHSSHHPMAIEVYRGRPIIYGCGDLINDYYVCGDLRNDDRHDPMACYRPELAPLYFIDLGANGRLKQLRVSVMRMTAFCLERASEADARWLCRTLNQGGTTDQEEPVGRYPYLARRIFNTRWIPAGGEKIRIATTRRDNSVTQDGVDLT